MNRLRTLLLLALIATTCGAHAKRPHGEAGQFDYYAVALSWSPAFCATRPDPDQCGPGRQLGFVLHGLWPQYEQGYPESCSSENLPSHIRMRYAALFPSPRLIGHEWSRHGTCSGLDPAAYFALSSRLKDQVRVPAPFQRPQSPVRTSHREFVQAFRTANPGIAQNSVLPYCGDGGRFLREVHVCYDKGGRSRSCSAGAVKRSYSSCRQETFLLQNVR